MNKSPIARFTLSIAFWLPACFGIWYFAAVPLSAPVAWMLDVAMPWLFPTLIDRIQQSGDRFAVLTLLEMPQRYPGDMLVEPIVYYINPLQYGYSIPLYTALLLASPGKIAKKVFYWLIGIAILLFVQSFGVATNVIKIFVFDSIPEARIRLGFSGLDYEILALSYQFGFLIFPALAPIVVWFWQFREFVKSLTVVGMAQAHADN